MPDAQAVDHRTRVAAARRQRMRRRLLESAMIVFAQKGIASSVIQDIVAAAEVSQGSFYNYFRTSDDLFEALALELSDEFLQLIESVIGDIEDPGQRVATGIRAYLFLSRSYKVVGQFIALAGFRLANLDSSISRFLPRDLKAGQQSGTFKLMPMDMVMDLIIGTMLMAIHRIVTGQTPEDYPEAVASLLLQALGVNATDADRLLALPLPTLVVPEGSLFGCAEARFSSLSPTLP
jgi:AcrR family transcriptional regulator